MALDQVHYDGILVAMDHDPSHLFRCGPFDEGILLAKNEYNNRARQQFVQACAGPLPVLVTGRLALRPPACVRKYT